MPATPGRRGAAFSFSDGSIGNSTWFPWALLVFVAGLAYLNAWPNVFVFDDREFLANGRFAGLGMADFASLFNQSLWEASGNATGLYRPLFMVSLGLQYQVFGEWAAGFHVFNIALHILATLLVFGFCRTLLSRLLPSTWQTEPMALLACVIFAVHPVFTEVVNSVFNGSEIYVAIGIAGGLWYLLLQVEKRPGRAWLVLSLVYFIVLLFRESAVSLPALAVTSLWFASDSSWKERVRQCLPVFLLLIPLAAYLALRSQAIEPPVQSAASAQASGEVRSSPPLPPLEPILQAGPTEKSGIQETTSRRQQPENDSSDGEPTPGPARRRVDEKHVPKDGTWARVSGATVVWFDGLGKMMWPHPLVITYGRSGTSFILALVIQLALVAAAIAAAWRKQPAWFVGLAMFYLAIIPSSRIISEGALVPILMERMLYLPSVGLVLFLAATLAWLGNRFTLRVPVTACIVLVVLLLPVTWARNQVWSDPLTLLEHDFQAVPGSGQLFYSLVSAYRQSGKLDKAMNVCDVYAGNFRSVNPVQRECGMSFAAAEEFARAESYFLTTLKLSPRNAWTHFELARLYVRADKRDQARSHFNWAISNEGLPFLRELMSAFMLMDLYPYDRDQLTRAREHVEAALQMQPRSREALLLRQQLEDRL